MKAKRTSAIKQKRIRLYCHFKMNSHKFTDYTYLEIKDFVDAGCLAIVPTGCTEQQGPHLPVDFDTWFAEAVALEAAQHGNKTR